MSRKQNQYIFKPLSSKMSISDKINIHALRYKNNYFLNVDLDKIGDEFDENVRPRVKVTKETLESEFGVSKDARVKIKKVVWVLEIKEEFAKEFKHKLSHNLFTSVKKAELEAAAIYSVHCSEYQSKKATVYSENGMKKIKRKHTDENETQNDDKSMNSGATSNNSTQLSKEKVIQVLKESVEFTRNAMLLDNDALIEKLTESKELENFFKEMPAFTEPITKRQRLADFIILSLFRKIDAL